MLSEKQEKFCLCVALYGMPMAMAAREAGYKVRTTKEYTTVGKRLIDNRWIASRISELRESFVDVDAVRRSVILEHMQSRMFRVTDYVYSVADVTDNGVPYNRLVVKPYEEWDYIGKMMCIGFDRNGIPIFRSHENATKELCRIFGFYKDNGVSTVEDTAGVLANAGLVPSGVEANCCCSVADCDDELFDGSGFDRSLGVCDEFQTDECVDDDFYSDEVPRLIADENASDASDAFSDMRGE